MPLGIRIQTFDWREDATPGLGAEPQSRIDDQAAGYDALIAVLGASLGSPTSRHASGSLGEIEDAISQSANSVFGNDSVMIFFKDVQLSLSADLDEAKKVQSLKQSLGPRGILWRPFADDDALRSGILSSLGRLISAHVSQAQRPAADPVSESNLMVTEEKDAAILDDLGIMDYSEIAIEEMEAAEKCAEILGAAMNSFAENLKDKTDDLSDAQSRGDKIGVRNLINSVADSMHNCADIVQREGDTMRICFSNALSAMRSTLEIQKADLSDQVSARELKTAVEITSALAETLDSVVPQVDGFTESISALPRMTKEINQAKRRLLESTQNLVLSMRVIAEENAAIRDYSNSLLLG